jgi:hypothetical protein
MATKTVKSVQTSPDGKNRITTYSDGSTSFSGPKSSGGRGSGIEVATNPTTGKAISAADLNTPVTAVPVPAAPVTPDYTPQVNALAPMTANGVTADTTPQTDFDTNMSKITSRMDDYIGQPQSKENIYNKTYKEAGIAQKQSAVNTYQSQLNSIVANSQAQQIATQGQGRGIPEAILGGQQAQIAREAAIQSLPIAAQLSAAQGDLQAAQSHLETLFSIRSADADAKYNYKVQVYNAVKDYTDKQQTIALNQAQVASERAYQQQRDNLAYARQIADRALQMGALGVFKQITGLDPASPTYMTQVGKLGAQITTATATKPPQLQEITDAQGNKVTYQWNSNKGQWELPTGVSSTIAPPAVAKAQAQGNIKQITEILDGPLATVVGSNPWTRANQTGTVGGVIGNIVKGVSTLGIGLIPDVVASLNGSRTNTIANVEQLRSQLSLDALIQAKKNGATFGALSDQEMKILSNSATKLSSWAIKDYAGNVTGYNTTEANFKAELDRINNLAKLDYLIKGGAPEDVDVTLMPDGRYATANSNGTVSILK